jgi:peptide/nickel transport system permease protein
MAAVDVSGAGALAEAVDVLKLQREWGRIYRSRNLMIGAGIILSLILVALLAPVIAPFPPQEQDYSRILLSPSFKHPFGTDHLGRDVFSRVVYGARIDLRVGIIAVIAPFIIGVVAGALAGYYGRWTDSALMRAVDLVQAFPFLVLIIAIVAFLGPGLQNMYIAVAIIAWVVYARLIRGEILVEKSKEYVAAAKTIGGSDFRIVGRHILPNVITSCVVYAMADIALYIGLAATLSFLGLGARPPTPEWGVMITEGRTFMTTAWWIAALPGLALIITGIAFSLIGDGLADALRPDAR